MSPVATTDSTSQPAAEATDLDCRELQTRLESAPPATPATMTDMQPAVGGYIIGGQPARPLSYFDYRIMQRLQEWPTITEEDMVVIVGYALVQTTEEEIAALFRLANSDPDRVLEAAMVWISRFGIQEMTNICNTVAELINEYADVAGDGADPDGELVPGLQEGGAEGNSKPSLPESPNSVSPSSASGTG